MEVSLLIVQMEFPAIRGVYTQLNLPTEFAAVTSPMDSSIVFPASYKAEADLCKASPIPAEVMAKLFRLLLSWHIYHY